MENMAKVGEVVRPERELTRLAWISFLCVCNVSVVCIHTIGLSVPLYLVENMKPIADEKRVLYLCVYLCFSCFLFKFLWEKVPGVLTPLRPPEGVPSHHEELKEKIYLINTKTGWLCIVLAKEDFSEAEEETDERPGNDLLRTRPERGSIHFLCNIQSCVLVQSILSDKKTKVERCV